jgi:hypothetical protein
MNEFSEKNHTILSQIHEGMTVYDFNVHKIGTVAFVQMTDEDPARPGNGHPFQNG